MTSHSPGEIAEGRITGRVGGTTFDERGGDVIADKGERNSRKRIKEQRAKARKANAGETRGSEEVEGRDVIVIEENEDRVEIRNNRSRTDGNCDVTSGKEVVAATRKQ